MLQSRGEQLCSAASRPAASSLPAALHPLRSGEGEGGRRVLGVRPPPQQAAGPRPAGLPGRPAVRPTLWTEAAGRKSQICPLISDVCLSFRKFWPISIPATLPALGRNQQVLFFFNGTFRSNIDRPLRMIFVMFCRSSRASKRSALLRQWKLCSRSGSTLYKTNHRNICSMMLSTEALKLSCSS